MSFKDPSKLDNLSNHIGLFWREARRSALNAGVPPDLRLLLFCIRDIPYGRPSDFIDGSSVVSEWVGTCSGKHVLVCELLRALDLSPKMMMRGYQVSGGSVTEKLVPAATSLRFWDVHNFVLCDFGRGEVRIDITWPVICMSAGFTTTSDWNPGTHFRLACPEGTDREIQPTKEGLRAKSDLLDILNRTSAEREAREKFIAALAESVSTLVPRVSMREGIAGTIRHMHQSVDY